MFPHESCTRLRASDYANLRVTRYCASEQRDETFSVPRNKVRSSARNCARNVEQMSVPAILHPAYLTVRRVVYDKANGFVLARARFKAVSIAVRADKVSGKLREIARDLPRP